jgi:hypothetical protein
LILAAMIIHLNDDHQWDRERIATWVADVLPKAEPQPQA